jgi:hypothetical protein
MVEILTKIFEEKPIYFEKIENEIFINATKTAKQFITSKGNQRDLNEWLNSKQTKEYIEALKKSVPEKIGNTLIKIVKGNFSDKRVQGTWIHQKLMVSFARWISPEFAIWCDEQIEEILQGTISLPKLSLSETVSETREALELIEILQDVSSFDLLLLERILKENSPTKLLEIDFQNSYFLPTELGKLHGISGRETNLLLEKSGFQVSENGIWKLTESGKEFGMEVGGIYNQIKWKIQALS